MAKRRLPIFNRNLLSCLVGEKIKTWDAYLLRAEFSHNHAVNRSYGFSAYQVIYDLSPHAPVVLHSLPDHTRMDGTAADFVDDIHRIHEFAHCNLELSMQKYKTAADAKR